MAYETGTATDYHDLLRKVVKFVTTNATLVGLSRNWAILRGYLNDTVDYIDNTAYIADTESSWDKSTALGQDDAMANPSVFQYAGWADYTTNLANSYLGVKFASAQTPTSYKVRSEEWVGVNRNSRAPKDWDVQWSDNGTTWTTTGQVRNETAWSSGETRTYSITAGGTHQYWRLKFIANNGEATYITVGRLRFYDIGNTWISRGYTPEYILKAPGLSGTEEIYCGFRLKRGIASDRYTLNTMMSLGYDSAATYGLQPYFKEAALPLWNSAIPYWLVANGQRLIVVAKVSTTYMVTYMGKFFPYATPSQYPYPVVLSSPSDIDARRWSDTTASLRSIQRPGAGSYIFGHGNQWASIQDIFQSSGEAVRAYSTAGYAHTLTGVENGVTIPYSTAPQYINQNPDGSYTLIPYVLLGSNVFGGAQVFGELDGIMWVSGHNNASENIVVSGGKNYLVVQNVFRTGWTDYCAVELA